MDYNDDLYNDDVVCYFDHREVYDISNDPDKANAKLRDMRDWLNENISIDAWRYGAIDHGRTIMNDSGRVEIYFKNQIDVMAFKLRWL